MVVFSLHKTVCRKGFVVWLRLTKSAVTRKLVQADIAGAGVVLACLHAVIEPLIISAASCFAACAAACAAVITDSGPPDICLCTAHWQGDKSHCCNEGRHLHGFILDNFHFIPPKNGLCIPDDGNYANSSWSKHSRKNKRFPSNVIVIPYLNWFL